MAWLESVDGHWFNTDHCKEFSPAQSDHAVFVEAGYPPPPSVTATIMSGGVAQSANWPPPPKTWVSKLKWEDVMLVLDLLPMRVLGQ